MVNEWICKLIVNKPSQSTLSLLGEEQLVEIANDSDLVWDNFKSLCIQG